MKRRLRSANWNSKSSGVAIAERSAPAPQPAVSHSLRTYLRDVWARSVRRLQAPNLRAGVENCSISRTGYRSNCRADVQKNTVMFPGAATAFYGTTFTFGWYSARFTFGFRALLTSALTTAMSNHSGSNAPPHQRLLNACSGDFGSAMIARKFS